MPLLFAIPYPIAAGTGVIEIQLGAQAPVRVSVATGLLRNAVSTLPDAAFVGGPVQRRTTLLNKIDALGAQLGAGTETGARNKLEDDIRESLERWIADGYEPETILQYSKVSLLALVDELIARLSR